jgi:putative Holliday junction resolvase
MRILAVDLGTKNIGTAVSDALGIAVRPVETIKRSSTKRDLERLRDLAERLSAEAVVVGLPLRMDGSVGDAARGALEFASRLRGEVSVPVLTQDERLTSYEAESEMRRMGLSRDQRRARSDQFAAVIILRDYLSALETAG